MNPPPKVPNADRRSREHLTPAEIDRLIAAARRLGRHGDRDAAMILLAYRHGLRVSELVGLRREQVDLRQGLLHVRRRKNGLPSTHPLRGPELRALREVLREYPDSAYVFISERGAPMTAPPSASWLPAPATPPNSACQSTRTCCAIQPASNSPTTARTPAPSSITSDTGISSTPPSILNSRPIASTTSGRTETVTAEPYGAWTEFSGVWAYIPIPLSGLVSIVIGVLLYASLPWSGLWVLGTLIGVALMVQGMTG